MEPVSLTSNKTQGPAHIGQPAGGANLELKMEYKDIKVGQKYYIIDSYSSFNGRGAVIEGKVIKKVKRRWGGEFICFEQNVNGFIHQFEIELEGGYELYLCIVPFDTEKLKTVIHNNLQEKKRSSYRGDYYYLRSANAKERVLGEFVKLNKKQQKAIICVVKENCPGFIKPNGQLKTSKLKLSHWKDIIHGIAIQKFPLKAL